MGFSTARSTTSTVVRLTLNCSHFAVAWCLPTSTTAHSDCWQSCCHIPVSSRPSAVCARAGAALVLSVQSHAQVPHTGPVTLVAAQCGRNVGLVARRVGQGPP